MKTSPPTAPLIDFFTTDACASKQYVSQILHIISTAGFENIRQCRKLDAIQ